MQAQRYKAGHILHCLLPTRLRHTHPSAQAAALAPCGLGGWLWRSWRMSAKRRWGWSGGHSTSISWAPCMPQWHRSEGAPPHPTAAKGQLSTNPSCPMQPLGADSFTTPNVNKSATLTMEFHCPAYPPSWGQSPASLDRKQTLKLKTSTNQPTIAFACIYSNPKSKLSCLHLLVLSSQENCLQQGNLLASHGF